MERTHFDVIVIGSGPGGEGAAMQVAKRGSSVAVIERFEQVGGGCTHWNTIPSKALRYAIKTVTDCRRNPLLQEALQKTRIAFPELARSAGSVTQLQADMRRKFYERNRVEIFWGQARFVDAQTLAVDGADGCTHQLTADHVVIATGSRPYHPPDVDFSHPRIFDSDTVLRLTETPRSLLIYGAGVVGCEYASLFRNLAVKVDLVNTRDRLLSFLDDEISDALAYHLRDQGVLIRNNEEYERVEATERSVVLHLRSGKRMRADALLWANGRTGNTDSLDLPRAGLEADVRGNVAVDRTFRTAVPRIYAVGDVCGPPALASAAYAEGRFAARHIVGEPCDYRFVELVPTGIYTSPEISSVGKSERELTAERIPYEVGHSQFASLARAQITGETVGMLKLLFHRETLELLGIHCFGYQAAEIVHIGQALMAQHGDANTVTYFTNATFNYPTMAEAYRVAALNGLNRLF